MLYTAWQVLCRMGGGAWGKLQAWEVFPGLTVGEAG